MSLLGGAALFSSHWSFPFYQRTASSRWTPAARFKVAPPTPARSSCPQGPRRAGPTAGTLDGGGMEDDDEEITAATLRIKPRPLPLSALSAFSYVPPRRLDPKEHSYYYRLGKVPSEADGFLYKEKPGMERWTNETGSFPNASKLCVHARCIHTPDTCANTVHMYISYRK
ncbi:uncharacterized protein C5orf49 homolog isoform X4 [Felis catus]|uniref:uncharacterized protein C5orf49 homolog isoform X4 n=1 Tax=Felis catus TaxID=9685 RepID=UPI001D199866|nr:uncharacterized protein C5orf49 homolog isoform X4 [Felis catus]